MADHQHGHAARRQRRQNGGKALLEGGVQPLGRLVQQQDIRPVQQHLGQRRPLLLAAGQVVGVVIQQLRQAAQRHRLLHAALPLLRSHSCAAKGFVQILPDGVFHEQAPGILRQHAQPPGVGHGAPLGRQRSGQQPQRGGFARAVAAQQRQQLAPAQLDIQSPHHVLRLTVVPEPQTLAGKHRLPGGIGRLRRQRAQRMRPAPVRQEVPPLPHGDGAGRVRVHRCPDAHGGGHGQKHVVSLPAQSTAHLLRRTGAQQPPAVQHGGVGGQRQRLLQPVLRQQHGNAQLPVQPPHRLQKVGGGDGIQLAGGLVQYQQPRLHHHHGGQRQQLLLSAGQLVHPPVEPVLYAEEGRHLRHPAADGGCVIAQALQPEGQLVPHLVGDGLLLRGLQHEADIRRLAAGRQLLQRLPIEPHAALHRPVGAQGRLQLPQEGGLAAAGGAAQHPEFALPDGQLHVRQRRARLLRIGEAIVLQPHQLRHDDPLPSV